MASVKFEMDYFEDSELIEAHMNCMKMASALHDIYEISRGQLKYSEEELSDHIEKLLEEIKEISGQFY